MYILSTIENEEQYLKLIEIEKKDKDIYKEFQIQNMVIQWLEENRIDFHPSFTGIKASYGQRRFMKSQGMRAGHPDLTIEFKTRQHEILFLELKTVKGVLSKEQENWINKKVKEGFAVSVAYGYYDSIYKIVKYMKDETIYYQNKKN